MFDEQYWEERYRSQDAIWSGRPNAFLVDEIDDVAAGVALDVGSGEGADAIWLAERGWRVTAVDISGTALSRGRTHALDRGAAVASRVEWLRRDVLTWTPPTGAFDLVSAQYMHLPPAERAGLFARLAAAVRAGGILLIVGHHPSDLDTSVRRPRMPELFFTAEEIAATLDPAEWDVVAAEARPHPATDPEGREVTVHDTVLHARRRAGTDHAVSGPGR